MRAQQAMDEAWAHAWSAARKAKVGALRPARHSRAFHAPTRPPQLLGEPPLAAEARRCLQQSKAGERAPT